MQRRVPPWRGVRAADARRPARCSAASTSCGSSSSCSPCSPRCMCATTPGRSSTRRSASTRPTTTSRCSSITLRDLAPGLPADARPRPSRLSMPGSSGCCAISRGAWARPKARAASIGTLKQRGPRRRRRRDLRAALPAAGQAQRRCRSRSAWRRPGRAELDAVADHGLPVLYALFLWWFSTGLILYLDGLPPADLPLEHAGRHGHAPGGALRASAASARLTDVGGAYAAFTCGLLIWGWQEMSFLMGYVTGPRREPCPDGCTRLAPLRPRGRRPSSGTSSPIAATAVGDGRADLGRRQPGRHLDLPACSGRCGRAPSSTSSSACRNLNEQFLPEHLALPEELLHAQAADEPAVPGLGRPSATIVADRWSIGPGAAGDRHASTPRRSPSSARSWRWRS